MRKYSSTVPEMTLGAQLSAGATTITLSSGAWPTITSPDTLTLVIEPEEPTNLGNEEIVYVTAHTSGSTTATIVRAQEGTTDKTHPNGSKVRHMITGSDLQEPHVHMNASSYATNNSVAVHGIGSGEGAVVGTDKTQTLKNKTINISDNNQINGLTVSNVSGIAGTYAPLASPNFTGTPTISGTAIATTASAPASHTHGNVSNDGKIGTTGSLVVTTGTNGTLTALAAGTTSQYLRGDGVWGTPSGGTSGVTSIAGTLNQITASASTGAVTLSLPSTLTLPSTTVATTQTAGDNSTKVATTAFVTTAVAGVSGGSTVERYVRSADTATINTTATAMFAASNSLTANSYYRFKYKAYVAFTFTSGSGTISFTHSFSNTPQEITWFYNTANDLLTDHVTVATSTTVSLTLSASTERYIEVEGYFRTNATTGGTFSPQASVSGSGIVIKKASSIELEKISAVGSWI
jgi:hypothetical protein